MPASYELSNEMKNHLSSPVDYVSEIKTFLKEAESDPSKRDAFFSYCLNDQTFVDGLSKVPDIELLQIYIRLNGEHIISQRQLANKPQQSVPQFPVVQIGGGGGDLLQDYKSILTLYFQEACSWEELVKLKDYIESHDDPDSVKAAVYAYYKEFNSGLSCVDRDAFIKEFVEDLKIAKDGLDARNNDATADGSVDAPAGGAGAASVSTDDLLLLRGKKPNEPSLIIKGGDLSKMIFFVKLFLNMVRYNL